ncbi:MAG: isochorismate synthase [Tannerellaceae bacterium]|nr:isochorismate synthase [Tannerellaceae bacterium]
MTPEQLITLDSYIRENRSFAVFRIPGEAKQTPRFMMQSGEDLQLIYSIADLNGLSGYIIAPFHISKTCPAVLIRPDIQEIGYTIHPEHSLPADKEKQKAQYSLSRNEYNRIFALFTQALKRKELTKLVLSRPKSIERPETFSPARAFFAACENYTRSYVYLIHTPQTGAWLGSTPELLLGGEGTNWYTVALAGTVRTDGDRLPEEWNHKNREEQQIVASYITEQLSTLNIQPGKKGPYPVKAAHLAHLKTDFEFTLADTNQLGSLLQLLHPTPAIAGIPKKKAVEFILSHEGYDRSYYSGFLGVLNPEQKSELYVNLRCMQIGEQMLTLYAGSGLLENSSADEEWQETEDKLQTMLRLIDN